MSSTGLRTGTPATRSRGMTVTYEASPHPCFGAGGCSSGIRREEPDGFSVGQPGFYRSHHDADFHAQ